MLVNKSNDEKLLLKSIKTITNSGLDTIDTSLWESIRALFKKCPQLIDKAFSALMIEMRKPHAEVRLSAMMLCNELFQRSHNFRINVIEKFEEILEITAGVNPNKSLPPPRNVAEKLKTFALRTVLDWKMKFAVKYPAILDYFHFLERCKNIDFEAVQRDIEADAVAKAEREREQERVRRLMFDSFIEEFNEKEADIEELINVINNCTSLLIPTPDDFFLEEDESETTVSESHNEEDFDMRLFGLRSSYNLEIKINPEKKLRVEKSDENAAVIENLRESVKIAKKRYITLVSKWEDMVKKYSEDSSYIEKVDDLKTRLDACIKKYRDLDIHDDDDSDDDADMVEVVKEGYEAEVLPIIREKLKTAVEPTPGPSSSKQNILESTSCKPELSTAEEITEPVPDWQDPELLAQLKASTGIDLKMPEKRKKGIRKKKPALGEEVKEMVKTRNFPGVSNVGILKNNPKARLKKKIFNRSAVKRVAEACNKLDRR